MSILESDSSCKVYGFGESRVEALPEVSIAIEDGDFIAIIGTSGSGKSTLLSGKHYPDLGIRQKTDGDAQPAVMRSAAESGNCPCVGIQASHYIGRCDDSHRGWQIIILTTLMFTTVFTIGFSLAKKADNLYAAGIQIPVGLATDTAGETNIRLDYYDNTEFEKKSRRPFMPSDISFYPFIYLGTILFVLFTVIISCRRPAKLASRVSPVEALKYNGQSRIKTKVKRTTDGGRLYRMSFRNVFREKKRALLVFASLFMGTMAFLSIDIFSGCLKLDNYIDRYLPNDFAIYTNGGLEENTEEEVEKYLYHIEKLAKELQGIDGVTQVGVNRSTNLNLDFDESVFMPFLENDFADEKSRQEAIRFYHEHADDKEKAFRRLLLP